MTSTENYQSLLNLSSFDLSATDVTISGLADGVVKIGSGFLSSPATTSDLGEGSNWYYTSARFNTDFGTKTATIRGYLSAGTGISYDNSTGVITNSAPGITYTGSGNISVTGTTISTVASPSFTGLTVGSLSGVLKATAGVVSGGATTANVPESGNLYYTNARVTAFLGTISADYLPGGTYNKYYSDSLARAAISAGTGISYNSTTGVITNGYTNWTAAAITGLISLTDSKSNLTYNSTTGAFVNSSTPNYNHIYMGNCDWSAQSTPIASRLNIGDGTGWKYVLSKTTSGTTTDLFKFNDSGNFGIGIDPSVSLDVNGQSYFRNYLCVAQGPSPDYLYAKGYDSIGNVLLWYMKRNVNGLELGTWTGGTAPLTLNPQGGSSPVLITGNLGIGATTSPNAPLEIKTDISAPMILNRNNANYVSNYISFRYQDSEKWRVGCAADWVAAYNWGIYDNGSGKMRLLIDSSGKVGIGCAAGWKFHVDTTTAWDGIVLTNNGSNRSYIVNDSVNGSQFVLADNGNAVVNINTGGDCILGTTAAMGCTYRKHQAFTPSGTVGTYKWTRIPINYQNEGGLPIHVTITRNITENSNTPYGGPSCEIKAMCRYWHNGMMSAVVQYDYHGAAGAEITNVAPIDNASGGCYLYVMLSGGCTYHLWTHVDSGSVTGLWEDSATGNPGILANNTINIGLNIVGGGGYATTPSMTVAGYIKSSAIVAEMSALSNFTCSFPGVAGNFTIIPTISASLAVNTGYCSASGAGIAPSIGGLYRVTFQAQLNFSSGASYILQASYNGGTTKNMGKFGGFPSSASYQIAHFQTYITATAGTVIYIQMSSTLSSDSIQMQNPFFQIELVN